MCIYQLDSFVVTYILVLSIIHAFCMASISGWLRADSLEELVGLDVSYHGGISGGSKDGVKKEYVEAYNRHKNSIRRRGNHSGSSSRQTSNISSTEKLWRSSWGASECGTHVDGSDPGRDQDAVMEEGVKEHDLPRDAIAK